MAQQREIGGRAAADLVLRLSRAALGEGFVEALTSAQWMALRYFSRANRFSRTVSAFAEFHATTRGTASQTVKGLIEQGYLARIPSETDGRSARVDLTDSAKAILARDPLRVLVDAAEALPGRLRGQLVKLLERMLGSSMRLWPWWMRYSSPVSDLPQRAGVRRRRHRPSRTDRRASC